MTTEEQQFEKDDFSPYHRPTKQGTKTIKDLIDKLPIDNNIRHKAEDIYGKMNKPIKKGNKKVELAFACVLFAYYSEHIICSPAFLARMFKTVEIKGITKIIKTYSKKFHPPQNFYPVHEYVQYFCHESCISQDLVAVCVQIAQELENDPRYATIFEEEPSDVLAVAIIKYCTDILLTRNLSAEQMNILQQLCFKEEKAINTALRWIIEVHNA